MYKLSAFIYYNNSLQTGGKLNPERTEWCLQVPVVKPNM